MEKGNCPFCEDKITLCGLCRKCYKKKKWREKRNLDPDLSKKIIRSKFSKICIECGKDSFSKGLCKKCYMFKWHGCKTKLLGPGKVRGANHSGCKRKDGYVILCIKGKRVLEHKKIMSEFLKRPLLKNESIHHKNGIRDDNSIENLELWSSSHPKGQRVQDKIEWCKEFLSQYESM